MLGSETQNAELRWSHALHLEHLAKIHRALGDFEAAFTATGQSYDQLQQAIAAPGKPSAKFLQNLVTVSLSGLQTQMRLGDRAALHVWAQRVIDSVKQLNPPPSEAPAWQVAIDLAKDLDDALPGFDAQWQPTAELAELRPASRASGQCVAAYQLARANQTTPAAQLLRQAAEYQPSILPCVTRI